MAFAPAAILDILVDNFRTPSRDGMDKIVMHEQQAVILDQNIVTLSSNKFKIPYYYAVWSKKQLFWSKITVSINY